MARFSLPTFLSTGLLFTVLPKIALAASEAEETGLPQFETSTYPGQLFWLAVTFVVVYVFLSKFALPQISEVLENRLETVQGDLDRAAKLKAEAEEVREAYEKSLAKAHDEARSLTATAQADIAQIAAKKSEEFAKKSKKRMDQVEARISNAKDDAMDDITSASAELAAEAARKLTGLSIEAKEAKMTIQAIVKEERSAQHGS